MDLMQNISSEAFLTNKFGDRYLYSINRSSFNTVGSQQVYQSHFPELLAKEEVLSIVIGTDSGLLLDYIKSKEIPAGSKVIFLELSEVLSRLEHEGLLQSLGDKIQCVTLSEFGQIEEDSKFRMNDYFMLDRVELLSSFSASDAFIPEYRELTRSIQQVINQKKWSMTVNLNRQLFIKTQLMNVAENRLSAARFNHVFAGKTAVLLGGGPSLDDFLPWLKDHRDKVVVLAVSRISRRLQEAGLIPDFVFSIDPQEVSFEVSREMLTFDRKVIFVNSYHVSPSLLSQWRGASFYSGALFPWETPLNIAGDYPHPGPTVTNTAFAAAVEMGFSKIILAGVDLCFDNSGNSHALGSCERSVGPQFSEQQSWVTTNRGNGAVTTYAMARAVAVFGEQARLALERGCEVFNSSLGAAEIPNIKYLFVEGIAEKLSSINTQDLIGDIFLDDTRQQRVEHYEKVISELLRAQTKLKQIKRMSNEALKCNDGLFGRNGMNADFKYKVRMAKIEKKLNRVYADFMPLVKSFYLKNILEIAHLKESSEWTDQEVEDAGRLYYKSLRNSADCLVGLIDDAVERTQNRLEEERPSPDFSRIFGQWKRDNVPGRALVWCDRNPIEECYQNVDIQQKITVFIEKFSTVILKKEMSHLQCLVKSADPKNAYGNALLLFKNHNLEGLSQLVSGLNLIDNEEASRVAHLIKGYVAELKGDPLTALEEYQGVFAETMDSVLEDALQRILILSLKSSDFENAAIALQCLTSISPIYLPQYADLLKLTGDVRGAVELYADYLEQVPDDINIMLKLGKIYSDQGLKDGAKSLFDTILKINPGNSAAELLLSELKV